MKGADTSSKDAGEAMPDRGGFAVSGAGAGVTNLAPGPFRETRYGWLVLGAVWVACAIYLALHLREGWIPHDPGTMGFMAERVLHGQLPHRDFIEVYTGGLDYLNALAFRLFGVSFLSLRIPLFLFFLGWVPSVYFIARRFAGPLAAGAVTLLSVAWSVPNYPEAMPSWYNLFFATWGVLALLRFTESEEKRWLWIAGVCGGLSFLAKISGLYFVAAGFLFLVFRELSLSRAGGRGSEGAQSESYRTPAYKLFATCGLVLFLVLLLRLISQRPTPDEFFEFALPSASLVALLLWEIWSTPSAVSAAKRLGRMFAMVVPFLGGMLVPVALFLLRYAGDGANRAFFDGVFARQTLRTSWEGYDAIGMLALVGLLPALLILVFSFDTDRSVRRMIRYAAPGALFALLLAAWWRVAIYSFFAYSLPLLVPLIAVAAFFRLRRQHATEELRRQQVFSVVAAASACALIQFPFSAAIYFEYSAPLVILALVALFPPTRRGEPVALGSLLAFYLAFAVWLHTPGFYLGIDVPPRQPFRLQTLTMARAVGIRASAPLASEYERLIPLVRAHARGAYIYAAPDCPEVYFLSGLRDPTRTVLDVLDPDFLHPIERSARILGTLENRSVNVVVICPGDSSLSGTLHPGLKAQLASRYPESATVDDFQVRWRR